MSKRLKTMVALPSSSRIAISPPSVPSPPHHLNHTATVVANDPITPAAMAAPKKTNSTTSIKSCVRRAADFNMGGIMCLSQGEYKKALDHFNKAMSILNNAIINCSSHPPKHPDPASLGCSSSTTAMTTTTTTTTTTTNKRKIDFISDIGLLDFDTTAATTSAIASSLPVAAQLVGTMNSMPVTVPSLSGTTTSTTDAATVPAVAPQHDMINNSNNNNESAIGNITANNKNKKNVLSFCGSYINIPYARCDAHWFHIFNKAVMFVPDPKAGIRLLDISTYSIIILFNMALCHHVMALSLLSSLSPSSTATTPPATDATWHKAPSTNKQDKCSGCDGILQYTRSNRTAATNSSMFTTVCYNNNCHHYHHKNHNNNNKHAQHLLFQKAAMYYNKCSKFLKIHKFHTCSTLMILAASINNEAQICYEDLIMISNDDREGTKIKKRNAYATLLIEQLSMLIKMKICNNHRLGTTNDRRKVKENFLLNVHIARHLCNTAKTA